MNDTIAQIRDAWKDASETIHESPEELSSAYPGLAPAQIDEAVETFCKWAERQAAPHGFKPVAALARTLLSTEAAKFLQAIKAFNQSTEWSFPFMEPMARALSFLSLAAVFSDKDDARRVIAEQGGKLAESLSLLDTAQHELGTKMGALNAADAILEKLRQQEAEATTSKQKAETDFAAVTQIKTQAEEAAESIDGIQEEIESLQTASQSALEQSKKLQAQNQALHDLLNKQSVEIEALKTKATEQSKQISELLPGATSAGLAAAFGDRARSFQKPMALWRNIFIGAVVLLAIASAILVIITVKQDTDVWRYFLLRIPVVLPIVWLAWFSAIQYGNAVRLEEHYSFKEATSKAFAGYREHIAQLSVVDDEDADTSGQDLVKQLAESTVSILGKPPAEVFSKPEKEASPLAQMLAIIVGKLFGKTPPSK